MKLITVRRQSIVSTIVACAALSASVFLVGCAAKSTGSEVEIKDTGSGCELSTSSVASGATTFEVTNTGNDVTEVYVYAVGSRIIGEVENIGVGSTRSFTTELAGGEYEIACKPGQKGDGNRSTLRVTGATTTTSAPSRTVEVTATEWGYPGLEFFVAKQGETVKFVLTNRGTVEHEMEVLNPLGESAGEVGPTAVGQSGEVVITFREKGEWFVQCGIEGHLEHGMRRIVEVL